ncbi:MAG TPA: type II and III secretion system protein family protein [Burkholderiaceae bacterium]|nr:type II and III secretion system protein family protein [Burkholderiaceae bacterium]
MNTIRCNKTRAALQLSLALAGLLTTWSYAATEGTRPAKVVKGAKSVKADAVVPPAHVGTVELAPQVHLAAGKSTLMRLPYPASRLAVGDARIADVILLKPDEVYMLGKSAGSTNLILWSKQGDATVVDLSVGVDTTALQARYSQLLQGEKDLHITAAADTLILSGTVSDVVKADQAMALATAYVQGNARAGAGAQGASGGGSGAGGGGEGSSPKVVNLLKIAAPQQVMLEVKVAEVSKTLVDQLGASLGMSRTVGSMTYTLLSNLLSSNPSKLDAFNNKNGNFASLDAQKRDGLIKVLAEPTIMAISGQEASFLAGGKIFIPVAQNNNGGTQTITLEEKEFGVAVKFTPTVLDGGRINLKVAPEVSDLNKEGVGVTATGVNTTAILPSFTTRRATTTVQLFDGQSFAIGGLIKNNVTTSIKAFPGLGEIPVLGALFRSSDFQTDRTELVFIVTPHLVQPLPADYKLPTDGYIQPSRGEFFLQGKLEGQPPAQSGPAPQQAAPSAGGFDVK